jgi:hypothetical protein
VFYYFPNNYMWSSALTLSMMAGGQLNQIDRGMSPLRHGDPTIDDGTSAAAQQEEHAADDLCRGFLRSAGERLLRASTYYLTGECQTPLGPAKTNSYQRALYAFTEAVKYLPEQQVPQSQLLGQFIGSNSGMEGAPTALLDRSV